MVRTCSVSSLNYEFIFWDQDSLQIKVPRSKADQNGSKAFGKHIYANPTNPSLCFFLSLGVHIVTSDNCNSDSRVFRGMAVEVTFSKWLQTTISRLSPSELVELGTKVEDIGTHSIRKGTSTHASSQPGGPSTTSIRLRMDHSLGNVEDRYIYEGDGSDQLLGRFVAGLPFGSTDFAMLPPHFRSPDVLTPEEWNTVVPGYDNYPSGFKTVIPYLIASLCKHSEFLQHELPREHAFFNTRFWCDGYHTKLCNSLYGDVNYCAATDMSATGLPVHHITTVAINTLQKKVESLEKQLQHKMDDLPIAITDAVLQRCQVNGAYPVTLDNLKNMLQDVREGILHDMDKSRSAESSASASTSSAEECNNSGNKWRLFIWKGQFHPVPDDFVLPRDNIAALFHLWYVGNEDKQIGPYSRIRSYDLNRQCDKVALPKLRAVFKMVEKLAIDNELIADIASISSMNPPARDVLFNDAYKKLMEYIKAKTGIDCKKNGYLCYMTIYKLLCTAAKQSDVVAVEQSVGADVDVDADADTAAVTQSNNTAAVTQSNNTAAVTQSSSAVAVAVAVAQSSEPNMEVA